jgi:lycopene cyclase domain-containing protein
MSLVSLTYLGLLVLSLAGLGLLDWHRRLALFADPRRTLLAVAVAVAFFLVWDTVAIGLGIFARGEARYLTGVELWPEMTLEEPVFLVLLSYVTLLLWRIVATHGGRPRPLAWTASAGDRASREQASETTSTRPEPWV